MKDSKGFTLVEVAVVVAIVGILVALVIPDFAGLTSRSRLRKDARDMFSNLQRARVNAIRQSKFIGIKFYPDAKNYEIWDLGDDRDWDKTADNVKMETVSLSRGVSFGSLYGKADDTDENPAGGVTFTGQQFVFKSDGTANIGGGIYLKDNDVTCFAITVVFTTGRIKLWKNTGTGWE